MDHSARNESRRQTSDSAEEATWGEDVSSGAAWPCPPSAPPHAHQLLTLARGPAPAADSIHPPLITQGWNQEKRIVPSRWRTP